MKKKYVKPEMFFEDFSLTTSIAANCKEIVGKDDTLKFGGYTLFISKDVCDTKIETINIDDETIRFALDATVMGKYDKSCYHNPSEEFDIFTS